MGERIGRRLNEDWQVNAKHALYREDGRWYNHLNKFPGAYFDANGYVVFPTEHAYRTCPYLALGKRVNVSHPQGISAFRGYVRVAPVGA
jgi:5-methylcytosine-specific restriction protein A